MTTHLSGIWYLRQSTFPMWHKEGVSNVTFNYTLIEKDGKAVLKDEVKYKKRDKDKSIAGFDKEDGANGSYIWRGKGILALVKTSWKVKWMSRSGNCMVISFEKTFATPAGVDILTRGLASDDEIKEALAMISSNQLLINVKEAFLPVA